VNTNGKKLMLGYKVDAIDIKGSEKGEPVFFPMSHPNIFMCAKKKSGKTNLIYHLMRNIVGKDTKIYVFCSTANRDQTWKQLIKELENKGNEVVVYNGLYTTRMEGKRRRNVNQLKELIDTWQAEEKPKKPKKSRSAVKHGDGIIGGERPDALRIPRPYENTKVEMLGEGHIYHKLFKQQLGEVKRPTMETDDKPKRKRRSKKIYSERIVIFDDLSEQIKDPMIPALLKKNRHYKACCIVSSQFPNDIAPSARSQFDVVMAWAGHNANKVEVLRRMCDTDLDERQFLQVYKEATNEPYSFLYANCRDNELWKRFDIKLN